MSDKMTENGASASLRAESEATDVVIVGAGFAGLYMLYRLRKLGLRVRVFEAGADVGGTWYWNRYPGARCDVESMQYSYSFCEELQQEWRWTEVFASQPEILRYARHVADRFDLRRDITFNTRVTSVHLQADSGRWLIETDTGERVSAHYCVMASGLLSSIHPPEIPHLECFRGDTHHTGAWPEAGVDFAGKTVAVIGTGSSGIQAIPVLAEQAGRLVVFQRTPNYVLPSANRPMSDDYDVIWKLNYKAIRAAAAKTRTGVLHNFGRQSALSVDEAARNAEFERRWRVGSSITAAYVDIYSDAEANEAAAAFVRRKIGEIVKDAKTAEALTPRTYPIGAKRVCIDSQFFATFNRSNVELVDLRETPIERFTERGIKLADKELPFDTVVFATGFDAVTGALSRIDIVGSGGERLAARWKDGPRAYLGLMSAGFPNLFMVNGPGSAAALSNALMSIEHHVDWIAGAIANVGTAPDAAIEPTPEAEERWMEAVAEAAEGSIFTRAASWFNGANVVGKPRRFLVYVGGVDRYRRICDEAARDGFTGFVVRRAGCAKPPSSHSDVGADLRHVQDRPRGDDALGD